MSVIFNKYDFALMQFRIINNAHVRFIFKKASINMAYS